MGSPWTGGQCFVHHPYIRQHKKKNLSIKKFYLSLCECHDRTNEQTNKQLALCASPQNLKISDLKRLVFLQKGSVKYPPLEAVVVFPNRNVKHSFIGLKPYTQGLHTQPQSHQKTKTFPALFPTVALLLQNLP